MSLETLVDVPFEIKRVYYVFDVKKYEKRGFHAHKEIEQFLWCPSGQIEVLMDNGLGKKAFVLKDSSFGLFVPKGYWHEMKWLSDKAILCVVASEIYIESDYIREYNMFLEYVRKGFWDEDKL